jgi:small subunit ribosomal protein S16
VVLTDSKNSTKSGKFLEVLGSYDPINDVKNVDGDRIKYWVSKGAQLSDTVHNYLIEKKIIPGKKVNALPKKKPIAKEAPKDGAKPTPAVAEAPKA